MEEIERIMPPTMPDSVRLQVFFLSREVRKISGLSDGFCNIPYEEQEASMEEEKYRLLGEFVYLYLIKKVGMRHIFHGRVWWI